MHFVFWHSQDQRGQPEIMGEFTMSNRACNRNMVLAVALAVAVTATGCATIRRSEARSTEQLLAAAGFEMRPADTAERQQRLAAMPPYQLVSRPQDGKFVYTYADPDTCKCLYVGGFKEYSKYQRLRVEHQIARDRAWAAQGDRMDCDMGEPWWCAPVGR
jgi:hypothetical protein